MSLQLIEAARLLRFDPETGWPESLPVIQAFALQTWHDGIAINTWGSKADDLRKLFALDQGKGTVKFTTWAETVTVKVPHDQVDRAFAEPSSWEVHVGHRNETEGQRRDRLWRAAHPTVTQERVVTHTHITAQAFAAWLSMNEIEPNRHVVAWFKAMVVNTDRRPIEPPLGWKAKSPHGLQRLDSTDAGRLVRLADLVQWLMDTKELPCKAAVEAVCSLLEQRLSAAAGWLCLLTEADYARPLPADQSFFWVADPLSFWEIAPPVADADKGLAGAIKYMREYWGQSAAPGAGNWMGQHVLDPLAVRVDVAHLLWGYGRRVDVTEKTQAATPAAPAELVKESPAKKRRVLKKKALVQDLQGEWPTIEQDLSEASRNGLNAAKADGYGNWDVQMAREWAESKGKLAKETRAVPLQAAWPGTVTTHRVN